MNILSIILLCFCSIVSSRSQIQEVLSNKTGRGGRFLGLFTVVQFTDEECLSEPHGGMRPIGKNKTFQILYICCRFLSAEAGLKAPKLARLRITLC